MIAARRCEWCSTSFTPKDRRNRFCCVTCSAFATGRKRYGDPSLKTCSKCKGEVEPAYTKYGRVCRSCRSARAKVRRHLRPELHRAAAQRFQARFPDLVRRRRRVQNWKHQGITITLEEYDSLVVSQGGRCAICRSDNSGSRQSWHVDHDHDFGHVRALLCHRCNKGLGSFADSPALLRAAAKYLEKHQPKLAFKGASNG